jgi:hypothetical protein
LVRGDEIKKVRPRLGIIRPLLRCRHSAKQRQHGSHGQQLSTKNENVPGLHSGLSDTRDNA